MKDNVQKICLEIGSFGSYFLCLLRLAEIKTGKEIDIWKAYDEFKSKGVLREKAFVRDAKTLLEELTGSFVSFWIQKGDYKPEIGEWVIKQHTLKLNNGFINHFTLSDEENNIIFNPAFNNPAFTVGKITESRVFEFGK